MAKTHYSAAELAAMKLPGLPASERGLGITAMRQGWSFIEVKGKGGRTGKRKEFAVSSLPAAARAAILQKLISTYPTTPVNADHPASLPVAAQPATGLFFPNPHNLTDKQRAERDARKGVLLAIRNLQAQSGCTQQAAITTLLTTARSGKIDPFLDKTLRIARDTRGGKGDPYPSVRTLKRWLTASDLAPKVSQRDMTVPAWAPELMKLYSQPQKRSLAWCIDELPTYLPPGITAPSYGAARRFIEKIGNLDREAGRMGPREIKSIRAYVKRDSSGMWPTECYTADGHAFDAEIAHPAHGKPFRPEITTVLDIATRKAVGWSADLAESTWAVLDALRHACIVGGIPAIFYVDNGSGYKNDMMANEATGFMGRLAITMSNSLPYNSQARGVIERSHQTIWIKGAKTLPTYMGADMDREAKQKAFKITRADIKATGSSRLLMPWNDFVTWCQVQIDTYNKRPHRALPKIRDTESGKLRHQSPNEAWQAAINEGWKPVEVEAHEADDLFRPYKECVTRRAMVQLFSNSYFHKDLEHHHGETVRVGYDIHDASRAWIRDSQGRLICVAEFEGNKRSYFPESFIEQAAQKRATGRIKRAQARIDEAEAELQPPLTIEHMPAQTLPPVGFGTIIEAENVVRLPEPVPERPMFETDAAKFRWLLRNEERITPEDQGWIGWYRNTSEWEDLFGEDLEGAAGR